MFPLYYPRQFCFGASFILTVAPILWGTRVYLVLSFLSLIWVFGLVFTTAWVFWSLVWLTVSSLPWEFFVSISSVNLVIASLHLFGGFLLSHCVVWVIVSFFIQILPCLVLSLDCTAHLESLGFFSFWGTFFSIWGLIVVAIEWNLFVFYLLSSFIESLLHQFLFFSALCSKILKILKKKSLFFFIS